MQGFLLLIQNAQAALLGERQADQVATAAHRSQNARMTALGNHKAHDRNGTLTCVLMICVLSLRGGYFCLFATCNVWT